MFEKSTSDARPIDPVGLAVRDLHRCASGWKCTNPEVSQDPATGGLRRLGALVIDDALCGGCMLRLTKAVERMPADYGQLVAAIGDNRAVGGGDKVHLTREASIPLNTNTEALMSRIVEVLKDAADRVADAIKMDGITWPKNPYRAVVKASKFLGPTLPVLLSLEAEPTTRWARCPTGDEGWSEHGQPHEHVELSGLDVAAEIVDINRLIGMQLGKSRKREHKPLPCPAYDYAAKRYCGAMTVGYDHGSDYFDCTTCGTRWSQDEYHFLTGLITTEIKEREENEVLRFLLAEAYWRLDTLARLAEALQQIDVVAVVNDGPEKSIELFGLITQQLSLVLTMGEQPHAAQPDRNPGTKPTKQRQKAIAGARKEIGS